MTLVLHRGAQPIDYAGLRELATPEPTSSHVPISHFRVVDLVKTAVGMYGHEVVSETHGVTEDGARYFGLLELRSPYTGWSDTVGLRNSHDKSFPVSVGFGSRVFVCDNLSFLADHSIRRKHTAALKRDLPGLIGEMIEPLAIFRERQHDTMLRYQHTPLTDQLADHMLMSLYKEGIVNIQRIPDVLREWEEPTFSEFSEPNVWRMFNAVTYALSGRITERPEVTPKLHQLADRICEMV